MLYLRGYVLFHSTGAFQPIAATGSSNAASGQGLGLPRCSGGVRSKKVTAAKPLLRVDIHYLILGVKSISPLLLLPEGIC